MFIVWHKGFESMHPSDTSRFTSAVVVSKIEVGESLERSKGKKSKNMFTGSDVMRFIIRLLHTCEFIWSFGVGQAGSALVICLLKISVILESKQFNESQMKFHNFPMIKLTQIKSCVILKFPIAQEKWSGVLRSRGETVQLTCSLFVCDNSSTIVLMSLLKQQRFEFQ